MIVTSLGHAGLLIETDETTLACDPWFSPEGAFQASWFQFPSNEHMLDAALDVDAVLISHEHMDHVDPWFLARLPAHVPVVCPWYPSPVLKQKILAGGERPIVQLESWARHEVGDATVFFVSEDSPMNHDSAMVIIGDETSVVNMNDARLTPAQLRRIRSEVGGSIDLLFLQAAGASWFPICYEYEPEHRRRLSKSKRLAKLRYVEKAIAVSEPRRSFPFAGPPCFLDDELAGFNSEMGEEGIFPNQDQAITWLKAKGVDNTTLLLPGDTWDDAKRGKREGHGLDGFRFGDTAAYVDDYRKRRQRHIEAVKERHPFPSEPMDDAFAAYFEPVLDMSEYFNERIAMRTGFEVTGPGGGSWTVDFRPGREAVEHGIDDIGYLYRFESRWLPPLLDGSVPWEDFFLSLRFSAWRSPDVYNDHLLGLLKFAEPDALAAVELYETADRGRETITVDVNGTTYEVERYCPHAGQDLGETGEILADGILRCLGHHYEFDITTGECLNGSIRSLQTKRV